MTRSRLVPVLLTAALLVGAANLGAYAATGDPLLLGKSNTATKTTKLKTTGTGPALKLKSKAGKAPFAVSNTTKISKLNADLVDGLDSSALQTKSYRYNLTGSATGNVLRFALPGLPAGQYVANYAVSADIPGTPTFFACLFDRGVTFTNGQIPALGNEGGMGSWFVSAGGVLDTTAGASTLTCQTDASGFAVPAAAPAIASHVVLTRIDDLTTSPSAGFPARTTKPGFGG
jgi:hypothetical protein